MVTHSFWWPTFFKIPAWFWRWTILWTRGLSWASTQPHELHRADSVMDTRRITQPCQERFLSLLSVSLAVSLDLSFSVSNRPQHAPLMMCLFCEEKQWWNQGFGKSQAVLLSPANAGPAVGAHCCPQTPTVVPPAGYRGVWISVCEGQPANSSNGRTCVYVLIHVCVCAPQGPLPEREGEGPKMSSLYAQLACHKSRTYSVKLFADVTHESARAPSVLLIHYCVWENSRNT